MAIKVWNGSAWVDAAGVFVWDGSSWVRRRVKYWNGSAWVDANVYTKQYAATKSRSYDGGEYESGGWVSIDTWASDTGLGQGRYFDDAAITYHGPYYGTMLFGSGSGRPTELSGKSIVSARLRLTRYTDAPPSGSSAEVSTTIYATNLTDVPASGAHSPDGQYTGSGITSAAMAKGETVWTDITALAQTVIAGKCLCLYTGTGRLSRHYGIEGSSSQEPVVEFTYF